MEDLTTAMARAADTLSESLAAPRSTGSQTRYGTVVANNGSTLDVAMAGGTVTGVLMTTACCSAVAGDRVLLDVTGPLVTATGILANSDNGPYVMRSGLVNLGSMRAQLGIDYRVALDMPSADYAVAVVNATAASYWTKVCVTVVGDLAKDGFTVRVYNDDTSTTVSNVYFRWMALYMP